MGVSTDEKMNKIRKFMKIQVSLKTLKRILKEQTIYTIENSHGSHMKIA